MKKYLITAFTLLTTICVSAQGYGLDWVQVFESIQHAQVTSITTEANGDIVASGQFTDTVDLDPGPGVAQFGLPGGDGIFVVKLDGNGSYKWGKVFGGNTTALTLREHAIDQFGGIYLAGRFDNTVDFDPGPGVVNKTYTAVYDGFLLKLDGIGNFQWVNTYNTTGICDILGVSVDAYDHVNITGDFSDTVDFDGGPGVVNLISGGLDDLAVAQYQLDGTLNWAKNCQGSDQQSSYSISDDSDGNIFISGVFRGSVDFDPGPSTAILSAGGINSSFILKLDSNGNYIWAGIITSTNENHSKCVRVNSSDDVFIAGFFGGSADFDPGVGTQNVTSMNSFDGYLLKLSNTGSFNWVQTVKGPFQVLPEHIAFNQAGSVLINGFFRGLVDFDNGPDTSSFQSGGVNYDMFLTKYQVSNGDFEWAYAQGEPAAYINGYPHVSVDANNKVLVGANFTGGVDFQPGPGKTIGTYSGITAGFIQRLNPCSNSFDTLYVDTCTSFTWIDSTTYTADDTVSITIPNHAGCDSTITMYLTINQPNSAVDSIESCDGITWIDGLYYDQSTNQPTFTLSNADGCDSIVQLVFNKVYVDTLLVIRDFSIEVYKNSDTYQWLDCDDNFKPIPNRTTNLIRPEKTGTYACEVTYKGCVDTTRCVYMEVIEIGIAGNLTLPNLRLYPNPVRDILHIDFGHIFSEVDITLRNPVGQILKSVKVEASSFTSIDLSKLTDGIYFIELNASGERMVERVVIW